MEVLYYDRQIYSKMLIDIWDLIISFFKQRLVASRGERRGIEHKDTIPQLDRFQSRKESKKIGLRK